MKLFALFAASAMAVREIPIGSATECWNCNAQNLADCAANGRMETCQPTREVDGIVQSSSSCSTTIRQREGNVYFVSMGCKDTDACVKQHECKGYSQVQLYRCNFLVISVTVLYRGRLYYALQV